MLKESPETSAEISNIVDELQGNNEQRENGQILSHSYLFDEFKCEIVATKGHKSSMIFGPTSVYSKCSAKSSGIIKDTAKLPISRVRIKVMLEITVSFLFFDRFPRSFLNHNLYDSICPFFAWQYTSYYLSIYRQSFLFHILQKDFSNDFVSEELIYALVALGAKNSFDNSLSKHTYEYYNHSKRNLLEDSTNKNSAFSSASVTKPQCLLYLAFFDITVGELTSGWLLSGIAFRMCFT